MEKQGVIANFTPAYQPQLNPIECVFALLRRKFQNLRTEDLMAGRKTNPIILLEEAAKSIELEKIQNIIKSTMKLWEPETLPESIKLYESKSRI